MAAESVAVEGRSLKSTVHMKQMILLTVLHCTLQLDIVRRGKGRQGRRENRGKLKSKRIEKGGKGKMKKETSRDNERKKSGRV